MKYLLFDASNLLTRTFFAMLRDHPGEDITGLANHIALTTLNKYYKQFNPHKTIMAFDKKPYWRDTYTSSDVCISKQPYKGDRADKLTTKQKEQFTLFRAHIKDLEEIIRKHTSIICMTAGLLEADDIIAGFVQKYANEHEVIIVSGDKDLIQLIQPNVRLYDPDTGKQRTLDEWDNDMELFLFEKCIRGGDDNIMSAFPRVRKTRIRKAYQDRYECANLMNTTWTHPLTQRTFVVREVFEENRLLMDLREQPEIIRDLIEKTITESVTNPGIFSYFQFMKYLGKYELQRVADNIDNYVKLLSS